VVTIVQIAAATACSQGIIALLCDRFSCSQAINQRWNLIVAADASIKSENWMLVAAQRICTAASHTQYPTFR
jgi:uncharacterized membrane protein YdcZ (DUF606 family)